MEKRLINYADRDIWNQFVASSSTSPILQSFEWGELKRKFGWQPIRIAVEDRGEIVAGISILKKNIPYIRRPIFYAPRGPIVDFTNREVLSVLLGAIEEAAEEHRAISLKIDPPLLERKEDVLGNLTRLGFVKSPKQIQPRATIHLSLNHDLEEILKGFEEKTRYNVRLAEKKGVVVQEDKSDKGIEQFYEMYRETATRNNFLIHPIKYYKMVKALLFSKGMATNFMAYYKGKPIASVIIFCFGKRIWYMYGASSAQHRNLMPNHLLHWEVIKWAKERHFKSYDLWGIPANPKPGHPLWGVYRFKKGFNGRTSKYIGAYDFPYSPLFYNVVEHGVVWWQKLRSLITKGKIEDSLGE